MSARKAKTSLTLVLDACLAGCADDIQPDTAANAIREHETLVMDLMAAKDERDTLRASLKQSREDGRKAGELVVTLQDDATTLRASLEEARSKLRECGKRSMALAEERNNLLVVVRSADAMRENTHSECACFECADFDANRAFLSRIDAGKAGAR